MNLKSSTTCWAPTVEQKVFLRLSEGYLYRKVFSEEAFGGHTIHRVPLGTKLAGEWLDLLPSA